MHLVRFPASGMGGLLCFPKASRKMQRTLKNLRVSLLCFLLTFLVLRNTIGAGKFGTPAQDFEEIRLHLQNVALHRRHFRVLAQAVEEEKPALQALGPHKLRNVINADPEDDDGGQRGASLIDLDEGKANDKSRLWVRDKQRSVMLSSSRGMQGNAAIVTLDVRRRNAPLLVAARDIPASLLTVSKKLESLRLSPNGDEQGKVGQAPAHGESEVVMVAGFQSSSCKMSSGEQLLFKSLKNKVQYSALYGYVVSASFGALDPQWSKPLSRLSVLQSTMEKYPHVEWVWWMPNEAHIITDASFELPLWKYTEFNIVLLGSVGATYHNKNLRIDLITDTFLIRNCPWSLEILQNHVKMSSMGGIGTDTLTLNSMVSKPDLQAVDISSLNRNIPSREGKIFREMYVENSAVLRSDLNDLALQLEKILRSPYARLPFITHVLGCKLCLKVGNEEEGMCLKQMERLFLFVEGQVGLQRKHLDSSKHSFM